MVVVSGACFYNNRYYTLAWGAKCFHRSALSAHSSFYKTFFFSPRKVASPFDLCVMWHQSGNCVSTSVVRNAALAVFAMYRRQLPKVSATYLHMHSKRPRVDFAPCHWPLTRCYCFRPSAGGDVIKNQICWLWSTTTCKHVVLRCVAQVQSAWIPHDSSVSTGAQEQHRIYRTQKNSFAEQND